MGPQDDEHAEIEEFASGVNVDFPGDMGAVPHMGASLALHLVVLVVGALAIPAMPVQADELTFDQPYLLPAFFGTPGEREEDLEVASTPAQHDPDGLEPTQSRCGEVRGGTMGEPTARDVEMRYGVQGPADNADPHISHYPWLDGSAHDWTIGFTLDGPYGDPRAPYAPWGRDDSLGTDPTSARGRMWGEEIRESFGSPGSGIGRKVLCPTCGSMGAGVERELATAEGGPTGTEPYHRFR